MSLSNLIDTLDTLLGWVLNWRFSICVLGGFVLTGLAVENISYEPLRWLAVVVTLTTCTIVGWRWNEAE